MDTYDLFGEDGPGGGGVGAANASMLETLSDLGGAPSFEPAVTGGGQARSAPSAYSSSVYATPQDTPLQKLASFGGADFNHMDPNAQSMYAQGYGTPDRPMGPPPGAGYPGHQRQIVRPTGVTASGQYPYQTDNMYSMPDVQVLTSLLHESNRYTIH